MPTPSQNYHVLALADPKVAGAGTIAKVAT